MEVGISAEERKRREDRLRPYSNRPFDIKDPFSWSYFYKYFAVGAGVSLGTNIIYKFYYRKPWYYGEL